MPEEPTVHPRVDVVMVTKDRRERALAAVQRVLDLPERPHVVVVDNGSSDGTAVAVATSFPEVDLVALPENRGAAGRTVGVRRCSAPLVAFVDDDSSWAPGALLAAARLLAAHPRLGLLAGRLLVAPDLHTDPTSEEMAASPLGVVPGVGVRVLGFLACSAVVRTEAYLACGGFHPRFGVGGEETLLAVDLTAAGWDVCYVPEVVAVHEPAREGRVPDERRAREARNAVWTAALRRPWPAVAQVAWAQARTAAGRRGVGSAVAGLSWVLRERSVDPDVAALLALLDARPPAPQAAWARRP